MFKPVQTSYNVWKDKEDWLNPITGVQDILATCVDTVTGQTDQILEVLLKMKFLLKRIFSTSSATISFL